MLFADFDFGSFKLILASYLGLMIRSYTSLRACCFYACLVGHSRLMRRGAGGGGGGIVFWIWLSANERHGQRRFLVNIIPFYWWTLMGVFVFHWHWGLFAEESFLAIKLNFFIHFHPTVRYSYCCRLSVARIWVNHKSSIKYVLKSASVHLILLDSFTIFL